MYSIAFAQESSLAFKHGKKSPALLATPSGQPSPRWPA